MRLPGTILLICGIASPTVAQDLSLPSDPLSGRLVFEEKGCIRCHALGGYGGTVGPDFAEEHFFGSSAELASALWNHIPEMNRKYRQRGIERPTLTESEMLNLMGFLYYLRYLGEPGSALTGGRLLEEKGCLSCHDPASTGSSVGPSFTDLEHEVSPVNLVQAMWNHVPAMQEEAYELGMAYPVLGDDDINDISAYLQIASAQGTRIRMSTGDPNEGRQTFDAKHCTACHTVDGSDDKVGPDFLATDLERSVTQIAGLMWNHGPLMREYMATEKVEWPEFSGNEMADLIAYLYFLGFWDEPGNESAGAAVMVDKGCTSCHKPDETSDAPDLASIAKPASLVDLASLMWNHAAEMEDLVLTRNMEWPELSKKEIQDLYAFLNAHSQNQR